MSAGEQLRARRAVKLAGLFRSQVSAEIPNKTCLSGGRRAGPGRAPKQGSKAHSHLWLQRQTEPKPAEKLAVLQCPPSSVERGWGEDPPLGVTVRTK